MIEVTKANLDEVLNSPAPLLLVVTSPTCGPCQGYKSMLSQAEGLNYALLDAYAAPEWVKEHKIRSVPFSIVLKNGEWLHTWTGVRSLAEIQEKLK